MSKYLCQPKLQENPQKIEELVALYYRAKDSGFLKMEGIKRKIDQLKVTIGEPDDAVIVPILSSIKDRGEKETKLAIEDYAQTIKDLREDVEEFLETPFGSSLPEGTQKSLTTFLHYLNHPNLINKENLVERMVEKYRYAANSKFNKMTDLNETLNMMKIKLGKLTEDMKKWKSREEIKFQHELERLTIDDTKVKLEEQQQKLEEAWRQIEDERRKMDEERKAFEIEKEKLEDQILDLQSERTNLKLEKRLIENEKKKLELLKKELDMKFEELETKLKNGQA
ncbi:MAG: hypothetical protein EU544_02535 [Promethearchaeota archaeon]|nr:MAG: hypothetical protein EU544_02535 [Candidatus Lokiarchaeota archaeon]